MTNDSWIKNRHQLFNDLKSPKSDQTQFYIFYSIIKWSGQTLRASTPSIFDLLYGNKSPNFFLQTVLFDQVSVPMVPQSHSLRRRIFTASV